MFNLVIGKLLIKLITKWKKLFEIKQTNIYKIKLILFINIKINNIFYINKIKPYKLPQLVKPKNLDRETKANKKRIIIKTNNINN